MRVKDELLHGAEAVWRMDDRGRQEVALTRMGSMRREPEGPFTFRFVGQEQAANPEELLSAAQVTCYASALTSVLLNQGLTIRMVTLRSVCVVRPEPEGGPGVGWRIDEVALEVAVEGELSDAQLADAGRLADWVCPISKALSQPVSVRWRGTVVAPTRSRSSG